MPCSLNHPTARLHGLLGFPGTSQPLDRDQRINIRLSSSDLQGLGTPALQDICERRVD